MEWCVASSAQVKVLAIHKVSTGHVSQVSFDESTRTVSLVPEEEHKRLRTMLLERDTQLKEVQADCAALRQQLSQCSCTANTTQTAEVFQMCFYGISREFPHPYRPKECVIRRGVAAVIRKVYPNGNSEEVWSGTRHMPDDSFDSSTRDSFAQDPHICALVLGLQAAWSLRLERIQCCGDASVSNLFLNQCNDTQMPIGDTFLKIAQQQFLELAAAFTGGLPEESQVRDLALQALLYDGPHPLERSTWSDWPLLTTWGSSLGGCELGQSAVIYAERSLHELACVTSGTFSTKLHQLVANLRKKPFVEHPIQNTECNRSLSRDDIYSPPAPITEMDGYGWYRQEYTCSLELLKTQFTFSTAAGTEVHSGNLGDCVEVNISVQLPGASQPTTILDCHLASGDCGPDLEDVANRTQASEVVAALSLHIFQELFDESLMRRFVFRLLAGPTKDWPEVAPMSGANSVFRALQYFGPANLSDMQHPEDFEANSQRDRAYGEFP